MRNTPPHAWLRWMIGATAILALVAVSGMSPPTGRPPLGPLRRVEPKLYDFKFSVLMKTAIPRDASQPELFELTDAPIMMPILFLDTFNRVNADSVRFALTLENREAEARVTYSSGHPLNTTMATLTIDEFRGQVIRWNAQFTTQVWSSQINDEQAALIPWPEEWPKEVQDALKPQMLIESDDAAFSTLVEQVTRGQAQNVPPYLVAKEVVRTCINQIQPTGNGESRGEFNSLRGMFLDGALLSLRNGRGSPHDVVCVCVAALRAAGIPARPVIGAEEDERRNNNNFVTWAEFYLPEVGWIPFDPLVMRGKGIRTMDVRKPWPEFGTMKDLNERIPLSHHFMPPVSSQAPGYPAVWGWDPRPVRPNLGTYQVQMNITSRGKGVEDPA